MCNMKIEAMDRAGETGEIHSTNYYDIDRNRPVVPRTALPAQYDASAVMAATRLMVDLGRTIDGAGTTTMISQAAAMLGALGRLPVVDIGVHVALTKVLRGELAAKEAECAELASRINAPVAGSVGDDAEFQRLMSDALAAANLPDHGEKARSVYEQLVAYLDSRPASAPSVDRNAAEQQRIMLEELFHYPECWDTAAYPSIFSALVAVHHHFECSQCANPPADQPDWIRNAKPPAPVAQPLAPIGAVESFADNPAFKQLASDFKNQRADSFKKLTFYLDTLFNVISSERGKAVSDIYNAVAGLDCDWKDLTNFDTVLKTIRTLAAPVAQPLAASAVPEVSDYDMFAAWKAYPLDALDSEGRFDKDWLNREFIAFKAGRSALAVPEGDAFQKLLDAEGLRILGLYHDGKNTFAECSAMIGALAAAPRQEAKPTAKGGAVTALESKHCFSLAMNDRPMTDDEYCRVRAAMQSSDIYGLGQKIVSDSLLLVAAAESGVFCTAPQAIGFGRSVLALAAAPRQEAQQAVGPDTPLKPVAWMWQQHGWIVTAHGKHRGVKTSVDLCQPPRFVSESDDFILLVPLVPAAPSQQPAAMLAAAPRQEAQPERSDKPAVQARRFCFGDNGWTEWQMITPESYALHKDDSSFEFRTATSQQPAASEVTK